MNIIIDIRPLLTKRRTGVGEYVFGLVTHILERDSENHYFLFYNSFKKQLDIKEWEKPNVTFVRTRIPNKLLNLSLFLFKHPRLDKLVERKIHTKAQLFFAPHINFTALSPEIKSALTIHDLTFELYPYFFSWRQRLWHYITRPRQQVNRADLVFTPSKNTADDLQKHYHTALEKIRVIYSGIDKIFLQNELTENIKEKYNLPEKYFLFLGTVEPRKNVLTLIYAFEKIRDTNISLVIAGAQGYEIKKIKKAIKNSSARNRIQIIGYIENRDKPALYKNAMSFIYPSFYEGFGFPILEALIMNTPVITSTRGSLPEIGQNTVEYINPYNPETITRAMEKILKNKKIVDTTALREKFNWDNAAEEVIKNLKIKNQNGK